MLGIGVLGSPQPMNPAQLAAALLPSVSKDVLTTWALQLSGSPTTIWCRLCTTVRQDSLLCLFAIVMTLPRTIPAMNLLVPVPHDKDHRLSQALTDQRSSSVCATCHHSVP